MSGTAAPSSLENALPSGEQEVARTIPQWCQSKQICIATYHKLKKLRLTPDELHIPGTNIKRIMPEADREWIARMAELTKTKEYEREAERRTALAKKAGDKAARSPKHISQTRKAHTAKLRSEETVRALDSSKS
jgi:hypothetical protein